MEDATSLSARRPFWHANRGPSTQSDVQEVSTPSGPDGVGPASRYHFGIIVVMAMTLRLTEDDERVLTALAAADGVSKQEATIRAIREVAERRGHVGAVAASSSRARSRYAEVLERLGR